MGLSNFIIEQPHFITIYTTIIRPTPLLFGHIATIFQKSSALCCGYCESVATIILNRLGVSLYPYKAYLMTTIESEKSYPQIGVFLAREAFALPAEDPTLLHRIYNIF